MAGITLRNLPVQGIGMRVAALQRPEVFRAVVGMNRPYSPPGPIDLLSALEAQRVHHFYTQYFQTSGVVDAEIEADVEADVAATLRRVVISFSGEGRGGVAGRLAPGQGFLNNTEDPGTAAGVGGRRRLGRYFTFTQRSSI